jgi:transposase
MRIQTGGGTTDDCGQLLNVCFTPGNISDLKVAPTLTENLFGKLVGDKGYISQALFEQLFSRGLQLITRIKRNMKNKLMLLFDKLLLRKRAVVETVIDQMKNISQIEHPRHRSVINYFADTIAGLIAYTYREKLPSLNLRPEQLRLLEGQSI